MGFPADSMDVNGILMYFNGIYHDANGIFMGFTMMLMGLNEIQTYSSNKNYDLMGFTLGEHTKRYGKAMSVSRSESDLLTNGGFSTSMYKFQ